MAEEKREISPAVGLGIAAGLAATMYFVTKAKAAPPEPEPGLANLYGKVTDAETGEAILGVRVALDGFEVFTDGGGNYAFIDLEPGSYALQFSKENYETATY